MEQTVLKRAELQKELSEIKTADILVGIPSYNNAKTIGHVVRAVQAGLMKYFPEYRSVLVNSDGGSTDGTPEVVRQSAVDTTSILLKHRTGTFHKIVTPYDGIPGKGSAFRAIFEIAEALNVKACAVVDSDLRSITPEWIELLLRPILEDEYEFVAPYYHRHKYDGTITNTIVYPLTRALYGKRIRQPIGGDFGFSGRLASFYLTKEVWQTDVARYGIDIWMTTTAVANGFKVCQAFLGAKIHDPKDPGSDLSNMLQQVVGTIFSLMLEYESVWQDIKGSEAVPTFGFVYTVGLEPIKVNLKKMIDKFRTGVNELKEFYDSILPKGLLWLLQSLAEAPKDKFTFPHNAWAELVYSMAVAWKNDPLHRGLIIKSMTPLYLGKVASFVIDNWHSNADEVEHYLEQLCLNFEERKEYLIEMWQQE